MLSQVVSQFLSSIVRNFVLFTLGRGYREMQTEFLVSLLCALCGQCGAAMDRESEGKGGECEFSVPSPHLAHFLYIRGIIAAEAVARGHANTQ